MSQSTESVFAGLSLDRLTEVFDLVKPVGNWKEPISVSVPKESATSAEIESAVVFFAGGVPSVVDHGDHWRVTGAGYYLWVGA
jgi:hypothetical protein